MSNTNRGRKRQAPTESSNPSEPNGNLSVDDGLSPPGTATFDETFSQISKGKRRRRRFNAQRRKEVADVRKVGACYECRLRKVRCTHVLQGTDRHPDPLPAPKPSPQPYTFDFETLYSKITYPQTILGDDAGQWPPPNGAQFQDPSFNDGSDLIATVPALTARKERLADELHDFENVIEDNSGRTAVKSVLNTSKWGQNSSWVISATALANKQQQSQPSTAYPYSNANFSIDVGASPSTPASSHADLLSPFTQDMGYCRCNTYGCDRPHRITQEIHLRHHQEIKHVDLRHPIVTYPCPVACGVKPFRKPAYRHNHIKCNHPELLPSPTQLLPSNVSECDTQPDKLAHVREFLAEEYLLGIEDNPIAIPDQRAPGEIDPLTVLNWRQQRSSRRAHQQRVYGEPRIRRSNSPMQSQLSAKTANNHTDELLGQFRSTSSNHGNGFTATNSNASFQWSALRGQQTMEVMSNVSGQHRMLRSHSQHTNSPTPSLVGQFADNMQISDQLRLFPSSSDIGEDVPGLPMQQDHLGMYMTTNTVPIPTSVALHRNWDLQNQSTNSFNPQSFNAYENLGCTPTEVSFQPENNGSDMSVPWSRQGPETSMAQADGFSSGLAHPGFQSDTQDTHYLVNHGSSLRFPIPPSAAKHPMITLNDGTMLHTGEDADLIFAPNTFNSDPIPSQRSSIPYLYYSTLSSSGASDSIVSPVDAPNPFSDKFGEDLDGSSSFFNGFNNMEVSTND